MGIKSHLLGALALSTLTAFAANAQEAPEPQEEGASTNEIIVEGYTKKEVREYLWLSLSEDDGRLVQRRGPICIGIDNAPEVLEKPIRARILANLEELDIQIADEGCTANAVVAFHEDAHLLVNWMGRKLHRVFGSLFVPEKRRLIRPVRAAYNWHFIPSRADRIGISRTGFNFGEEVVRSTQQDILGLRTTSKPAINSAQSYSVIDLDALDGLTIEQVGDYLTLRMLVVFRERGIDNAPGDSILRLFDGPANRGNADAPPEMSRLDRAMLKELYSPTRRNFRAGALRQAIARASVGRLNDEGLIVDVSERN